MDPIRNIAWNLIKDPQIRDHFYDYDEDTLKEMILEGAALACDMIGRAKDNPMAAGLYGFGIHPATRAQLMRMLQKRPG